MCNCRDRRIAENAARQNAEAESVVTTPAPVWDVPDDTTPSEPSNEENI